MNPDPRRPSQDIVLYLAQSAVEVVKNYFRSFIPTRSGATAPALVERRDGWLLARHAEGGLAALRAYAMAGGMAPPAAMQAAHWAACQGACVLVPEDPRADDRVVVLFAAAQADDRIRGALRDGGMVRVVGETPVEEWGWWG